MAYVNIPTLTDWQYDESTKKIKHNTGSSRVTVNALYTALMDLADDEGFMDSSVPMSAQTPTEYTLTNGWTFDSDSDPGYLYGGSIVVEKAVSDKDVWANFYTLGTIESDGVAYWLQNGSLVASHPGYTQGHIDQLIKVTANGSDIDSRNVVAFMRNRASSNADLYDHFPAQASATGGRNPVPLATAPDPNDDGSNVSAYTITIGFAGYTEDVDGDSAAENYTVKVDAQGAYSCQQAYRWLKHMTRRENNSDIGNGTEGRFYRKANGAWAEVKQSPFGTFAGGKFFGARGVLLTNVTDPNNRQLIDDGGTERIPPVTVSIAVSGLVAGDRVIAARTSGGVINKSQFTLNGVHSSTATVTVNEVLTNDIPDTGIIRLGDSRHTYSGINRGSKQFTGVSPVLSGANLDPLYQPYVDDVAAGATMSKSFVYVGDFDIMVRARKKGIVPFQNTATVTTSGASVGVIRQTDSIVS